MARLLITLFAVYLPDWIRMNFVSVSSNGLVLVVERTAGEVIAIDGKTLRRSYESRR